MRATPAKVKATTRHTLTRATPVYDVSTVTGCRQSRGGDDPPTPDEIRTIEAAFADAMRGFCATPYASSSPSRKRGDRKETRGPAEVFEKKVAAWAVANHATIVASVNRTLTANGSAFQVSSVKKADTKSTDLVIRFRRIGKKRLRQLPVNVKVNSKQKGLSLVAGEQTLMGVACTGRSIFAVTDGYAAWGAGHRGNGYTVLAYIGSSDARAEQVVFYNPILTDPKNWEWNLRYPQMQADHMRAAAAYQNEKLPATFDAAGARFIAALTDRMRQRLYQRIEQVDANLARCGIDTTTAGQRTSKN